MSKLCSHCNESPAVSGGLRWYAIALLLLSGHISVSGQYCADCAGGRNFMALLLGGGLLIAVFVLVVIFW